MFCNYSINNFFTDDRSEDEAIHVFSCFKDNCIETCNTSKNTSFSYNIHQINKETLQETDNTSINYYGHNDKQDCRIDYAEKDLVQNNSEKGREEEEEVEMEKDNSSYEISDTDNVTIINDSNTKRDNTIMFERSETTVDEVAQMIQTYRVRFNCSDEARFVLFNMASIWAGPTFSKFMNSKYTISKCLDPPENIHQYVFYCTECNCILGTLKKKDLSNTYRHCNGCRQRYKISTEFSNYFVSTDIRFQLQILLRNPNMCKLLFQNIKNI